MVILFAYAAVHDRLLDIDRIVMRAAATVLTAVIFSLPMVAFFIWVQNLPVATSGLLVTVSLLPTVGLSIALFSRLRSFLEQSVEGSLFPGRRAARDGIRRLSRELSKLTDHRELAHAVTGVLADGLRLKGAALYRRRAVDCPCEPDNYAGAIEVPEKVTFAAAKRLVDQEQGPWDACIPIDVEGEQLGFIAVAQKLSGAIIDDSDHALLSLIAGQVATTWKNIDQLGQIRRQTDELHQLHKRTEEENVVLRAEVRSFSGFSDIIGASPALLETLKTVEQVAPAEVSVLVTGETGTGKELIARAIHELSSRREKPLISVNCPAIPADLAESELFGHERGAFTGAVDARPGKFEISDGGTIFLDEVADLPLAIQVKLLRVLQEHEIQRIGGHKVLKLNLRVVAATNRDLAQAVLEGAFREDLYFRLGAVQIRVPALRERVEDVPLLASFFLQRATAAYNKAITGFVPEAMTALQLYNWPGNIRELQHVIERATLLCSGDRIRPEHLGDLAPAVPRSRSSLAATMRAEKRRRVEAALEQSNGNQAAAARLLGMSRSNFGRLLKSLGLKESQSLQ